MNWTIGCAATLFALFLLYHSRLDVAVRARTGDENEAGGVAYLLGGAIRLRIRAAIERDDTGRLRLRVVNGRGKVIRLPRGDGRLHMRLPPRAGRLATRFINLKSLGFSMTIGISYDAAITAQLCALALCVLETASCVVRAAKPGARVLMRVSPYYNKTCFRMRFSCIAGIKIGHLIRIAAIIAAYHAKGAFKKWLTQSKTLCVPPWKTSRT